MSIRKRYSEFDDQITWFGRFQSLCAVPPLPKKASKSVLGFLEKSEGRLQYFLKWQIATAIPKRH